MAHGEHDWPDPSLIVVGTQKSHPSKRIQGDDYPITPLEELRVRTKGMYSPHDMYIPKAVQQELQQLGMVQMLIQAQTSMKIPTLWIFLNQKEMHVAKTVHSRTRVRWNGLTRQWNITMHLLPSMKMTGNSRMMEVSWNFLTHHLNTTPLVNWATKKKMQAPGVEQIRI